MEVRNSALGVYEWTSMLANDQLSSVETVEMKVMFVPALLKGCSNLPEPHVFVEYFMSLALLLSSTIPSVVGPEFCACGLNAEHVLGSIKSCSAALVLGRA